MAAQTQLETTWINEWVDTGDCDLTVPKETERMLSSAGLDLADITYGLRTGVVVDSDMDESKGRWVVLCRTVDDEEFLLTILVDASEYAVELIGVETSTRKQRS